MNAPNAPGRATKDGKHRTIVADVQPANREARMYFQTAAITGSMPSRIGLPAYQNAGIVRIQKDAVQATAIPTGPHLIPSRNRRPVNRNSTIPHRNQRSALPMER